MVKPKIFGIGLSKTGTSSLARALEILGYKTRDYPGIERYVRGDVSSVDAEMIESNDAVTDTPIPSFYRELDARYPRSKFILTVREREGWLVSCRKQFTEKLAERQNEAHKNLFIDLYGTDVFDEQKFRRGYDRFVAGVLEYFAARTGDLLVIDVTAGEGWEKLCPFLSKPIPDVPFPKANVTSIRWIDIAEVVSLAKRAGDELWSATDAALAAAGGGPGAPDADPRGKVAAKAPSKLFTRALAALVGGDAGTVRRAKAAAHDVVARGLRRLTPQIPVLSRGEQVDAYAVRARWNHAWLVDVSLASPPHDVANETVVSIALIEDGRPIYGVVFAPQRDVLYFGKLGQGAYRVSGGNAPTKLASRSRGPQPDHTPPRAADDRRVTPTAIALCECLAQDDKRCVCDEPSTEWNTAAAHAIARVLGRKFVERETREELKYNTPTMSNHGFFLD